MTDVTSFLSIRLLFGTSRGTGCTRPPGQVPCVRSRRRVSPRREPLWPTHLPGESRASWPRPAKRDRRPQAGEPPPPAPTGLLHPIHATAGGPGPRPPQALRITDLPDVLPSYHV